MNEPNCRVLEDWESPFDLQFKAWREFKARLVGSGLMVTPQAANRWWGIPIVSQSLEREDNASSTAS